MSEADRAIILGMLGGVAQHGANDPGTGRSGIQLPAGGGLDAGERRLSGGERGVEQREGGGALGGGPVWRARLLRDQPPAQGAQAPQQLGEVPDLRHGRERR
jgi:hypothetical protein